MSVSPIRGPSIHHDGPLKIATAHGRDSTAWKTEEILWSDLVLRMSQPVRAAHTVAQYTAMKKSDQDDTKDVGGYTKGPVRKGRRVSGSIPRIYMLALDLDWPRPDLWDTITLLEDYAALLHSTHSHRPNRPRLRLVVPLSRWVTPDEEQAVARRLAFNLDIEQFDPTTFQTERLNYWPSLPKDGEYVFEVQDGPWLDPDTLLAQYDDWQDPAQWPAPEKETAARTRMAERAEDPHSKRGVVGAFCRTYSIEDCLSTFLADIYVPSGPGRYTYKKGSATGGLVVYEGKFAYSHHGTDPVGGQLLNAFDLVRLHLYGHLDEDAKPGTPVNRLPSYTEMRLKASEDPAVKEIIATEAQSRAAADFDDGFSAGDKDDTSWMKKLTISSAGTIEETRPNILRILENDVRLKGKIALNEFTNRASVLGRLPWRKVGDNPHWHDRDDEALRLYLEAVYEINAPGKTHDALGALLERHKFHPVRDYLQGLSWDGVSRAETLFIDYLGANDTEYVRAVTRKALVAAVARVMRPGCKMDYMAVLVGPQGVGKSYTLRKIGRRWFSDSLTTVQGKEAYEQLQGVWIMEMGELAATRRAETEAIKLFISKQSDIYRVAYGRHVTEFPRQCVFFGSTNDVTFLRDQTGNRRFWPIVVGREPATKSLWATDDEPGLTSELVDQIWAEAVELYDAGETLYLDPDMEAEAREVQREHTMESEHAGIVRAYLERPLPADWEERSIGRRRDYLHGSDFGEEEAGEITRDQVCVMEVWMELFQGERKNLPRALAFEIHDILSNTEGWERHEGGTGKLYFGPLYGHQRAYIRIENEDGKEGESK